MIAYLQDRRNQLAPTQWDVAPSVYFDHCVLRRLSTTPTLRNEFLQWLKQKNGTLCLSFVNVLEFSRMTDLAQIHQAEEFIAECVPSLFFLECNPFRVSDNEVKLTTGELVQVPPHSDIELFHAFQSVIPQRFELFPVKGFLSVGQLHPLADRFQSLTQLIVARLEALRVQLVSDKELERALRSKPRGRDMQQDTKLIFTEVTKPILRDPHMRYTIQHASDLLHTVVPMAYCDHVFVDSSWAARGQVAAKRIRDAGVSIPIAKIYSAKPRELEQFLSQ